MSVSSKYYAVAVVLSGNTSLPKLWVMSSISKCDHQCDPAYIYDVKWLSSYDKWISPICTLSSTVTVMAAYFQHRSPWKFTAGVLPERCTVLCA